jgi:chromosome segregation ATPase
MSSINRPNLPLNTSKVALNYIKKLEDDIAKRRADHEEDWLELTEEAKIDKAENKKLTLCLEHAWSLVDKDFKSVCEERDEQKKLINHLQEENDKLKEKVEKQDEIILIKDHEYEEYEDNALGMMEAVFRSRDKLKEDINELQEQIKTLVEENGALEADTCALSLTIEKLETAIAGGAMG